MAANRYTTSTTTAPGILVALLTLAATAAFAFTLIGVPNNATSGSGTKPHSINEVSVLVQPIFSRYTRSYVDTAIAAFMEINSQNGLARVRTSASSQFTSPWPVASQPLPITEFHTGNQVDPFNQSGDPVIAANPLKSGTLNPSRIYVAGTTWNSRGEDQITVWYTDCCPTLEWSAYPGIQFNDVYTSPNSRLINDKPAIAVSQHPESSGYVYLAFVRAPADGVLNTYEIQVWRLGPTNEWTYLGTPVVGHSPDNIPQSPRIDIDQATGTVYLMWLDLVTNTVNVRVSTDQGTNWVGPSYTWGAGPLVTYTTNNKICTPTGTSCFFGGRSFLSSSFHAQTGSLAIAYHRRKGSWGAEVVMRRFTYPAGVMTDPVVVSSNPSHDQWHPAVACSPGETCFVTYYNYDQSDLSTIKYKVVGRKVTDTGLPLEAENVIYNSTAYSDRSRFYVSRIEYQDIFFRNGTWYAAFVYGTSNENTNDVYVARLQ